MDYHAFNAFMHVICVICPACTILCHIHNYYKYYKTSVKFIPPSKVLTKALFQCVNWRQFPNRSIIKTNQLIKWKHLQRYWPFASGIRWWPVDCPHKAQWHGVLMFSLISAWPNAWANNRDVGDLRRHRAHCDVTDTYWSLWLDIMLRSMTHLTLYNHSRWHVNKHWMKRGCFSQLSKVYWVKIRYSCVQRSPDARNPDLLTPLSRPGRNILPCAHWAEVAEVIHL